MPPENSSAGLLEIAGLEAGYGQVRVLWGVDLNVGEHETVLLEDLGVARHEAEVAFEIICGALQVAQLARAVRLPQQLAGVAAHLIGMQEIRQYKQLQ